MEQTLPAPDVLATAVPVAELVGTARSLALAAERAGYAVRATRALGPRVPRTSGQDVVRVSSVCVTGVMGGWAFTATHTVRDGWDVVQHRPGWPAAPTSITALRATLRAQTPTAVR